MQIDIGDNTIADIKKVIELRHTYNASKPAETEGEIAARFELMKEIENLELKLGWDLVYAAAGKIEAGK